MKPAHPPALARRSARGVSLIEVLVVLVLFSFGLIGVIGLQAKALQYSVSAEDSNRAAMLANEMASAMWVNQNVILPPATLAAWNTAVGNAADRGLPNGVGTVIVQNDMATITVNWRAPHEPSTALHTYTTHVRLVP
jgi:type IV pilus assembly protein PilV